MNHAALRAEVAKRFYVGRDEIPLHLSTESLQTLIKRNWVDRKVQNGCALASVFFLFAAGTPETFIPYVSEPPAGVDQKSALMGTLLTLSSFYGYMARGAAKASVNLRQHLEFLDWKNRYDAPKSQVPVF